MQHGDTGVQGKVISVEGENVSCPVHDPCCYKPGIVGLFSRNAMRYNKPTPLRIDSIRVRESKNTTFDTGNNSVSLGRAKPESVVFDQVW